MLFSGVHCPLVKLLLWLARGSNYWGNKWILEEKNLTNRRFLQLYLSRGEAENLEALQGFLLFNDGAKASTKWEVYRLFAVMEIANNGSLFAQTLLEGLVTPFQAGKLGLARHMELLVDFVGDGCFWQEEWVRWARVGLINGEFQSTEHCFKVNKLTKV